MDHLYICKRPYSVILLFNSCQFELVMTNYCCHKWWESYLIKVGIQYKIKKKLQMCCILSFDTMVDQLLDSYTKINFWPRPYNDLHENEWSLFTYMLINFTRSAKFYTRLVVDSNLLNESWKLEVLIVTTCYNQ